MVKIVHESSVELLDYCGSDLSTVNAARVSFNKQKDEFDEKDDKLVKYLSDHGHTSPFNHAFLSFRVSMPLFVARQLVKHKFLPWNEVSRRYVDEEPEFYLPSKWRERADNKKQGSGENEFGDIVFKDGTRLNTLSKDMINSISDLYKRGLDSGVCPEQMRMIIPQNMMTTVIWSGTLGAWCDMLLLRLKHDTQKETREVAEKIAECVEERFPACYRHRVGIPMALYEITNSEV